MIAILQVQSIAYTWREVARVSGDPTVIAARLDNLKQRYKDKPVRAIDADTRMLIDIRI